jgi:hypothetical protein
MIEELKQYLSLIDDKNHFKKGITQTINLKNAKIFFVLYSDIVDVTYIDSESTEISLDDYYEVESVIYEWLNENK